jgi:hypothetical protein
MKEVELTLGHRCHDAQRLRRQEPGCDQPCL